MTTESIKELAKRAGGTPYTNRHFPEKLAVAFSGEALDEFVRLVRESSPATAQPEKPKTFLKERAQLEQEWCELRALKRVYSDLVSDGGLDPRNTAPVQTIARGVRGTL